MDKRIREIRAVQESTIDIKKGTMTLFPKKGWHIEIDDVLNAVDGAGFTPQRFGSHGLEN
ncbi:hypothetical protein IH992_17555 [Candidatus Poribacteria bacterium]|nr:hypothetical protein [Candidatus Poribacteria bacterium]